MIKISQHIDIFSKTLQHTQAATARQILEDVVRKNDEICARVRPHCDTIIAGSDLLPISSTMDNTTTTAYASQMSVLSAAARSACRDLDPSNEMMYLRVRTKKNEVCIAVDEEFTLITVQGV